MLTHDSFPINQRDFPLAELHVLLDMSSQLLPNQIDFMLAREHARQYGDLEKTTL
ncbi:hypothetical protein [Mycobacterium uberis]|uniref:hypothetical protein n=1 Tax=Mycobacterium uberis TaxID=2162698 RepID=UPI001402188C|nr:hypothetical protein [Mycobacterium uberis]